MKKWAIMSLIVAGLSLSVSAEYLEQWQFNDAAGVNLNAALNTGSHGSVWTYGDPANWEMDGVGNMIAKGAAAQYEATGLFPGGVLASPNTYSLEMKISAWEVETAAPEARLTYRLQSAGGANVNAISFRINGTGGARFSIMSAGANYKDVAVGGGAFNGGAVTARIDFNVVAGTAEYFIDGASVKTVVGATFGDMEKLHFDQENSWSATTPVIKVDELSLSVIPEPATLGLVSIVGAGLLAVRRFVTV